MNDQELRQRFEALRAEEQPAAPSFAGMTQRRARRLRGWLRLAGAVTALLLIVSVAIHDRRKSAVPESLSSWRAPTDFLLETPGDELLESVPRIGSVPKGVFQ